MHGSEAVARPTGTCADAETIVKPELVERAAAETTRKPGMTEVSDRKEIGVDRFQAPKSAVGTGARQGSGTERISNMSWLTSKEFLDGRPG